MQEQDKWKDNYARLVEGIAREAGLPDIEREPCSLVINEVRCTLMHTEFVHPERVMLFVEFGKPPVERRDLALQRLLETNLYMCCEDDTPSFAFNAETESVVLTTRLSLGTLTPTSTLALLRQLADYVKAWRASFFLDPPRRGVQDKAGGSFGRSLHRSFTDPSFGGPSKPAAQGGQ